MDKQYNEIFKSKRFWSAVVGLVMMLLVNFVPQLASNADLLTESIMVIVGLLIGGYSLQDAVTAARKDLTKSKAETPTHG